jgi:hypothetical protein
MDAAPSKASMQAQPLSHLLVCHASAAWPGGRCMHAMLPLLLLTCAPLPPPPLWQELEFVYRTSSSTEVGIEDDIRASMEALGFKIKSTAVAHDEFNNRTVVSSTPEDDGARGAACPCRVSLLHASGCGCAGHVQPGCEGWPWSSLTCRLMLCRLPLLLPCRLSVKAAVSSAAG